MKSSSCINRAPYQRIDLKEVLNSVRLTADNDDTINVAS